MPPLATTEVHAEWMYALRTWLTDPNMCNAIVERTGMESMTATTIVRVSTIRPKQTTTTTVWETRAN